MLKALAFGGAIASLLGSVFAGPSGLSSVLTDPPEDKIVIDVVTVNGSGCPPGSAAVAVSPDNTAFTVTYSTYLAQVGLGAAATDFRKNCQLNLIVHVPSGFTYAISDTVHRGFGHLEKGAYATVKAGYYFQGSPETTYAAHRINGPLDDNWSAVDQADLASSEWSPCGALRNFNINTELRAYAGTSNPKTTTSFITMDSTDGQLTTVYHFAWKKCPSTSPSPSPSRTKL